MVPGRALFLVAAEFDPADLAGDGLGQLGEFEASDSLERRQPAAQVLEEAEAYRANAVNSAEGEAARFLSVYEQYKLAPDVTRKRLFLETMEGVMKNSKKVIIDEKQGGQGVVPFLPLNELGRATTQQQQSTGGTQ